MAAGGPQLKRQPDFSTVPRPDPLRRWERLALVLGVLAVGLVALAAVRARGEAAAAAARLAQTRAEVDRLAAQRSSLTARGAAGRGAEPSSSPARIVVAIAAALPDDARLQRLRIDYGRGFAIEMDVATRSTSAWDRLLEGLERSAQLREVVPGPESRGGAIRSVVHARWAGGGRR
jgi:hypothetical protein